MKKIFVVILFCMLMSSVLIGFYVAKPCRASGGDNWWNSNWQYRKEITIDYTKVSDDLQNFPVLISYSSADFVTRAQSGGNDFVVTTASGSKLNHEIEYFNSSTGELVIWVNIPFLSASQDTLLNLYYGNPTCGNQQNVTGTWNSDFAAVWHFNTNPDGTIIDSTRKNNGTSHGTMTLANIVNGPVGNAYSFDGVDDYINAPNSVSLCPTNVTVFMWCKSDRNNSDRRWITGKGGNDEWGNGDGCSYGFQWLNDRLGTIYETNVNSNTFASAPARLNIWYLSSTTFNASTNEVKYYQNGSLRETINRGQGLFYKYPRDYYIAACFSGSGSGTVNQWVKCVIDEVWIVDRCLSPSFINTTWNNQHSSSTFMTIGTEETQLGTKESQPNNWFILVVIGVIIVVVILLLLIVYVVLSRRKKLKRS